MKNMINWFEIPVSDFNRAKKFYETIFGMEIEVQDMLGFMMGMFPADEGKVSGAIVAGDGYKPSMEGAVLYLNGNPDLSQVLNKVEAAGGKVIVPKFEITPEIGHCAFFIDTEGNKIALHSQN